MSIPVLAISFDAHHAARLAQFWAQALHRAVNDGATGDFASIAADTTLGPHSDHHFTNPSRQNRRKSHDGDRAAQ